MKCETFVILLFMLCAVDCVLFFAASVKRSAVRRHAQQLVSSYCGSLLSLNQISELFCCEDFQVRIPWDLVQTALF